MQETEREGAATFLFSVSFLKQNKTKQKNLAALPFTAERPWYNICLMQKISSLQCSANEMFRLDINQDSTSAQVYLEIERSDPSFVEGVPDCLI